MGDKREERREVEKGRGQVGTEGRRGEEERGEGREKSMRTTTAIHKNTKIGTSISINFLFDLLLQLESSEPTSTLKLGSNTTYTF